MGVMQALGKSLKLGQQRKVRYAVVGAGWIAQSVFMPGVAASGNSELTALVTGDAEKARELKEKYRLQRTFDYEQFDELLGAGLVDAVYVSTPNWDHERYAVRALDAGVHVLLEKPAEISVERAQHIFDAAERAHERGVYLMVAYRLHFEPATLDGLRRVREGEIGEPIYFSSQFSQHVSSQNHRAQHGFDAGPVPDMAPYPINAVRNFFCEEPIEVSARGTRHADLGLGDLDDTVAVTLRFRSGKLAQFVVSYAANPFGTYQVVGTRGVLEMSPAYTFQGALEQRRIVGEGLPAHEKWKAVDQFAGETRYFSSCVLERQAPEPDAEEALLDVRVIEAIRRALLSGRAEPLEPRERTRRIDPETQVQRIAARKPPPLVHAAPPEKG